MNMNWTPVANNMLSGRWAPAACLLADGKTAVIAGGYDYAVKSCVATIDLFDEATRRFRASKARLNVPRDFVQANLLPDGTVLLSGGFNDDSASLDTAEIYDPASDSCRLAQARMIQHRELFQTVALKNGTILLLGGLDLWARKSVATAEIYDSSNGTFSETKGHMAQDRFGHSACALSDGRVLIVGGTHWDIRKKETRVLDSAEIYDPATQTFRLAAGRLQTPRDRPTTTLLPDGDVLIYGGQGASGAAVATAELFDSRTEQFQVIPAAPQEPRMAHDAVLIPRLGYVLIAGGWNAMTRATTATSVLFDPIRKSFASLPNLPFASHDPALLAFPDGEVLCAGGKSVSDGKSASVDAGALIAPGP
jgi:hypothetical protein